MVTGEWLRQKLVEPLKEKQRQEGRAEAHIEWREWIERKTEAEAKGEHFDEPMPDDQSRGQVQNGSQE